MNHFVDLAEATLDGITVVDPHLHVWDPFTTPRVISRPAKLVRRFPWLRRPLLAVFPQRDKEFIGDPRFVLEPYLPAHYAQDALPLTLEQVVHIEAGWQDDHGLGETSWVQRLAWGFDGAPRLGAIVVHADPRDPDVGRLLDAHTAASDLVRGVRFVATNHPDPGVRSWVDESDVLGSPAFLRGFAALADRGLSFEVWVYHHQLAGARRLAAEYPGTTFVLDHHATPVGALGPRGKHTGRTSQDRAEILARWREEISATAELPNVWAKQSGIGMPLLGLAVEPGESDEPQGFYDEYGEWVDASLFEEPGPTRSGPALGHSWDLDDDDEVAMTPVGERPSARRLRDAIAPLITHTQACFGSERTLWASNYPIDKPGVGLVESAGILIDVLGDDLDVEAMFGGNARRLYRLDQ